MPASETAAQLSNAAVASAIAVYAVAMLAFAASAARRATLTRPTTTTPRPIGATTGPVLELDEDRPRSDADFSGALASALTLLGVALHASGLLMRGVAAGRVPWGNMYEFAVAASLAAAAAFVVFLRFRQVRDLGVWLVGLVVLTLGLAVTVLYTPAGSLVPVLNSYWLVIHVAAAITAGGVFTVGAIAAGLFLARDRADRRSAPRRGWQYTSSLPTAAALDRIAYRANLFAFPVWTFAVIAGAIWAENSWGRYWGWDPKETWAFITWVLYAAYLHAQATPRWRGRRAAWLALAGFLAFVFNFFGVNLWISGLHSYAGI